MQDRSKGEPKTIGAVDCLCCSREVPVKKNGRGTLNTSCPWCGFSSYAKEGTEAHKIVTGWVRVFAAEVPKAAAVVAPAEVPKAAAVVAPAEVPKVAGALKKIARAFDMGEL
jgi:hypothetical protein